MPEVQKLLDDPAVRVLLWCLLEEGKLSEEELRRCGLNNVEARAIMQDGQGRLRHMKLRHATASRFNPAGLASLLRSRLAVHLEGTERASELSALLRCMRQLPDWIFVEWMKAGGEDLDRLLKMAGRDGSGVAAAGAA
ncbi:hypothetical protein KDL29_15685 [bacterium]|nr:hypothetical protein [bacterium]